MSNDQGTDVTRVLAPDAPRNGRIIGFNVAYQNDPDGRLLVTMVKEDKEWKVMGFNINSPKITENQTRTSLQSGAPAQAAPEM